MANKEANKEVTGSSRLGRGEGGKKASGRVWEAGVGQEAGRGEGREGAVGGKGVGR